MNDKRFARASSARRGIPPEDTILLPLHPSFQFTAQGIVIKGSPTYEQWQDAWQWLRQVDKASPWIAGDMLAYGEISYSEFSQELEIDNEPENGHYSYGSLRVYKYTSSRWPLLNRLTNIPWSYHYLTASLPLARRLELIEQVMNEPKPGRRKRLEQRVRQENGGQSRNSITYPGDTIDELIQDNYNQEKANSEFVLMLREAENKFTTIAGRIERILAMSPAVAAVNIIAVFNELKAILAELKSRSDS